MLISELVHQSNAIVPELIIALAICLVVLVDMFTPRASSRLVAGSLSFVGVAFSLLILVSRIATGMAAYRMYTFGAMVTHDVVRAFFELLFLLGTGAAILFSMRSRETESYRQGEYFSLLLGGLLGAMFLVAADNLLMLVIGLETLSLSSYVLAASVKRERLSAEAGLKYLIFGAVASAVMLFGIGYLYGMAGTLAIGNGVTAVVAQVATGRLAPWAVLLTYLLILGGVGFKIAMVPFHFWCPDVYQGAPTPVTAYLSVVSKAAGFGALLRLTMPLFSGMTDGWAQSVLSTFMFPALFGIAAVVTMTLGNLIALRQTDVKRLLAYSSIAHAGYVLLGMTVYEAGAVEAMSLYLFIYLFMNLGAFWIVTVLVNRTGGADLPRFSGIALRAPWLFTTMFIFLISLTGIPPTAGFAAKLVLFKVIIAAGIQHMTAAGALTPKSAFYFALAVIGVLNSVISLYYYMKIARVMAFEAPETDTPLGETIVDRAYAVSFAIPTILLLHFVPILTLIRMSGR